MSCAHPETRALATRALQASGCRTHEEFAELLGGVGMRSLRRWLLGEGSAGPLATMVLRNIAAGWKPGNE